jgi:hypothetical protein
MYMLLLPEWQVGEDLEPSESNAFSKIGEHVIQEHVYFLSPLKGRIKHKFPPCSLNAVKVLYVVCTG